MKTIRIGAGSGFGGDRIEPALELAESGRLDYLVFECLAERTTALAQLARLKDPDAGFDRLLVERMNAVLPIAHRNRIRIVTNMGAANPKAAAERIAAIARALGLSGLKVACVLGDDVLAEIRMDDAPLIERQGKVSDIAASIVSANAYLGIGPIVEALAGGADVVVTGRCGDPALFVAPMAHEFGWSPDDWEKLGAGTAIGHLLECSGQLTGGYFADPGFKDVKDLARLGFPLAEVFEDGTAVLTKVEGSGGAVTIRTCKEQLLYEVHDPATYLQPDVTADFTDVEFTEEGPDRVRITGATGRRRPDTLKVTIGYRDGFIGEGQISYAGDGALARARLALDIVAERLKIVGAKIDEIRFDVIGIDATLRGERANACGDVRDVRARVVGRSRTARDADRIGREIEATRINGPAGGGGATWSTREVLAAASALIERERVATSVTFMTA